MEKKLLSVFFLISLFFLNPLEGFGQCPTSVGVTASPGTTICAGEEIIFTANPSGGSGYEYQWQIDQANISGETSSTFKTTSLTNGQKVRVIVTSSSANQSNCPALSSEVPVTVNPIRTVTATISANNSNICPGETVNFTISSQTNIGSSSQYEWRVNGTSQGTNATFSSNILVAGDQVQLWVDSSVPCTDPVLSNTISITEKPGTPGVPGTISGETTVCPAVSNLVYSISSVTNATSYEWVLSSGWSGTSTSNSITVTSGNTGNATISVRAKNECGNSELQTLNITVQDATPPQPGTISGPTSVCPGVTEEYSITAVSRATEYVWTLPDGSEQVTTTPTITVTTNSSGSNSNISVKARNTCGTSSATNLSVSLKPGKPATPGIISGDAAVCPGISKTYSVAAVTGATEYIWSLPNGWTGSSTTRSINVTTGSAGGEITVIAKNDCDQSEPRQLTVTVNPGTPAVPGFDDPITDICPGDTETFTVVEVEGATEYIWTLPSGWSGNSTTNTIQITAGTSGTGSISVQAKNSCGTSAKKTIQVAIKPPVPTMSATIEGEDNVCASSTGFTYTIPEVQYATEYEWNLPTGWAITNGVGNRTITVNSGSSGGNISVVAKNECGTSSASSIAVTTTSGVPNTPGTVSSSLGTNTNICPPLNGVTFSVDQVSGAIGYEWSLPAGWEIASGADTRSIIVNITANAAYQNEVVSVRARNVCGLSESSSFTSITVSDFIIADLGADQLVCRSRTQLTIPVELYFGGSNRLKPTWSSNGDGTFENLPNIGGGNSANSIPRNFTIYYTPGANDITKEYITITMTVPPPQGSSPCGTGKDEMRIYFRDNPTASITAPQAICTGASTNITITGTPNSRVTYQKGSQTGLTVDVDANGTGIINTGNLNTTTNFKLNSVINLDNPTCSVNLAASVNADVVVTQTPTATITYQTPFCANNTESKNVTLAGTNAYTGGTYSSTSGLAINNTTGTITPTSSTPGTYTVTYTTTATGGCEAVTASTDVTITPLPSAAISYADSPFCTSDTSDQIVTLTGTNAYSGGAYSSSEGLSINSTTGVIKASSSTPGTYTVTYTIPAASGCDEVIAITEVSVTEIPALVISYSAEEICIEDSTTYPPTIEGTGKVTGGTFSAPSGLNITSAGVIDATSSTAGTYKIMYTLPEADGCGQITAETEITITPIPSVDISYEGPYCESTSGTKQVAFTNGTGAFENGSFSSSPSGLQINTSTGAITPIGSEPNEYTIIYTIPSSGGCDVKTAETTVSITPVPKATISYNDAPFCAADASSYQVTFTNTTGSYEKGTFSGTTGLNIDSTTGEITPGSSSAGPHTVTYTIPTAEGCDAVTSTVDVTIFQEVTINSQPFNIGTCTGEGVQFEVSAAGDGLSYQWFKGTYPGSAISGATSYIYNINTVTSQDDGIYYVEVSGTAPCEPVRSDEVTLNLDENIIVEVSPQDENVCLGGDVTLNAEATANGGEVTYQWRLNGNDLTGENDPELNLTNVQANQAGEYSVFIEGPQGFTCSSIETSAATLTVYESPIVGAGQDFEACSTENSISIGSDATASNHSSLVWTSNGQGQISNADDLTGATYAPQVNDYGESLIFTLTAILEVNGVQICTEATDTKEIKIIPQPELTAFTYTSTLTDTATEFCETDTEEKTPTIDGENLYGNGSFTVDKSELAVNSGSGAFIPNGTEPGVYIITYTFTADSETGVCTEVSRDFTVTIGANPVATFSYDNIIYCRDIRDNTFNTAPTLSFTEEGHENVDSFSADNPGLSLDAATGAIDLSASAAGNYKITRTVDYLNEDEDGCQPVTAEFNIEINNRPIPDFSYSATEICSNDDNLAAILGTGAVLGVFSEKDENAGLIFASTSSGEIDMAESTPGTYTIVNTVDADEDGCDPVTAEFTITIKKLPDATFNYSAAAYCQSSGATQAPTITGDTGGVFTSSAGLVIDANGVIDGAASTANDPNDDSDVHTVTYTFASDGICEEVFTTVDVRVDAPAVGGELSFENFGRVFMTCEINERNAGNIVDLNLVDFAGKILAWKYRTSAQTEWSTVMEGGIPFTGSTLIGPKIESLGITETTVFQVQISSGACTPNDSFVVSQTAILSVISSNIEPAPVTVNKEVICIDELVILSSRTGYDQGTDIGGEGAFGNSSITNKDWIITDRNGNTNYTFNSSANNTNPDKWLRQNPRNYGTASLTSPYTVTNQYWSSDGQPGFAMVSGDNPSTLETAAFSLGNLDQAILTFDQAYNLTPGASIKVELSLDGGANYLSVPLYELMGPASSGNYGDFSSGTVQSRPLNKMLFDLGNYLGQNNLRIRFSFSGIRNGDIWALDNIDVPNGPSNVGTIWKDYTIDPENPILIGTNNEEEWTPSIIGWNTSVITTTLEYTNGSCETAINSEEIKVFAFDRWTTSVAAEYGTCGNSIAKLTATATGYLTGVATEYPTPDGYIGKWVITGGTPELTSIDPAYSGDVINNPNVTITAENMSTLNITWELVATVKDENNVIITPPCLPVPEPREVIFNPCIALDFDGVDDYVDLGENYTGTGYSIEAWVKPATTGGTIISGPQFNITAPAGLSTTRWTHIAVTGGVLYIDGVASGAPTAGAVGSRALIGARWNGTAATDHFHGYIEEVRIWDGTITLENIRFTMNQRLKGTGNIGEEVDMFHPDAPLFTNLAGYYRLISAEPDPIDLVTHAPELLPTNGTTPDLALNDVPGVLKNMETNQENTAPLPYITGADGAWDKPDKTTWARPNVWDIPNTSSINWNIVRLRHNVNSPRDITVLGLISEDGIFDMLGTIPSAESHTGVGTGNALIVSHYLKLDGIIDLNGESQLLQPELSIVDNASAGHLDRDQQGKRNSFVYNYWSSPVSITGSANNGGYTVGDILWDGTNPASTQGINFQPDHWAADGARTSPITISTYWLWAFTPAAANVYAEWDHIRSNRTVRSGEGFTMKGSDGSAALGEGQNYTFRGKPHNADITLTMGPNQNYLIGNPYPSAIDATQFITDHLGSNPVFDGSLYFWDHFVVVDHILKEYIGGYAVRNLTDGVPAVAIDERINDTGVENTLKYPGQYMPVGQGFMINSTNPDSDDGYGGTITFKNSQRAFELEGGLGSSSLFLKPEIVVKTGKNKSKEFKKIRLSFSSPVGYHRQILVGAVPTATDGFDLGYDAHLFDDNIEDMYWMQGDNKLVIQAVADFNKDRVIPLGIKVKENKEFRIRLDTLENGNEEMNIYLNDKLKDSIHDLRKFAYFSTSEPGTIHDRFELVFFKEETLPPVVELPGGEKPGDIDDAFIVSLRHAHNNRELQILNPQEFNISAMYLFDLNGNQLEAHTEISNDKEVRMPVKNYSSGVYIVQLIVEGRVISKRIIINN